MKPIDWVLAHQDELADWFESGPPVWRISLPGSALDDGMFHAFDGNDHQWCNPIIGLQESHHPPTEGDAFCPVCMEMVQRHHPGSKETR